MIQYNPTATPSLLKYKTGAIKDAFFRTLNSSPVQVISPNQTSYIFPVSFTYMLSGGSVGGTLPLYLNTPYQANIGTGAMQNSTIAPANSSGVYSMYTAFADFYYPETSSGLFDPNLNYLQLWQSADQLTVSLGATVPYVLFYYEIAYSNFEPI